jgi:hypothetical protein
MLVDAAWLRRGVEIAPIRGTPLARPTSEEEVTTNVERRYESQTQNQQLSSFFYRGMYDVDGRQHTNP